MGLATIRSNRGLTLEQIADSTKISMRSLRAIEEGKFEKLPGGIYNTSYLRQYAKAIDFDESELLGFYNARIGLSDGPHREPSQNGGTRGVGNFRPISNLAR